MKAPERIVSLVPSISELVWWLGAGERLVGRTRFCAEPAEMATVAEFGGTKNPDVAGIIAARPDLTIANKEENRREDVEALRAAGLKVLVTDPATVRQALDMTLQIGVLLGCETRARELYTDVAPLLSAPPASTRVFVGTWYRPLMAMGGDTYGNDVMRLAGGANVFAHRSRYPEVTMDEVREARPDFVVLPDEPFRFTEKHTAEFETIAPAQVVNGQWLWWYGPRMGEGIRRMREILGAAR